WPENAACPIQAWLAHFRCNVKLSGSPIRKQDIAITAHIWQGAVYAICFYSKSQNSDRSIQNLRNFENLGHRSRSEFSKSSKQLKMTMAEAVPNVQDNATLPPASTTSEDSISILKSESVLLNSQIDEILATPSNISPQSTAGISLLELKNNLLLSYIHNLNNLLLTRLLPASLDGNLSEKLTDAAPKLLEQLVWLRLVMEKLRPMESRLKYQIEKLMKTVAETNQSSEANLDHIVNDPLSFKPNPQALEDADNSESHRDAASQPATYIKPTSDQPSLQAYRPPRVAPMVYPGPASKSKRPAPAPQALREHVALSASVPTMESITGLSNAASRTSNRAKALASMNEYEESNMMRLFSNKKEARRRREDEAAIALGMETSSGRHQKRRLGALEGEFAGVLGDISRSDDRYSAHLGSSNGKKPKSVSDHSNAFGVVPSNRKRRKPTFTKAVAKMSKNT
ncbi:hypothetical protein O181_080092, partial [Austropuccinia psidii MF-1]|nr:hypothetical protein [Austropuccinia psidii MF-1]